MSVWRIGNDTYMTSSTPRPRRTLSRTAIALGVLAVIAGTASFTVDDPTGLQMTAVVLIILALVTGQIARRQQPPV